MIQVRFRPVDKEINSRFEKDSFQYVALTLSIGDHSTLPDTLYSRNFCQENFIEFRFNETNRILYEITLLTINESTINNIDYIGYDSVPSYYECILDDNSCQLEFSISMSILRSKNSFSISWANGSGIKYFTLASNCLLGVDANSNLVSVLFINMNETELYEVFGF